MLHLSRANIASLSLFAEFKGYLRIGQYTEFHVQYFLLEVVQNDTSSSS